MRGSVLRKARESSTTKEALVEQEGARIVECGIAMADRFAAGGRLLTFGNGGSGCDAQHMALEFVHPIVEKRAPLPALCLTSDPAVLSAVGNDEDFSRAFVKRLSLLGSAKDIALGISTSGKSANVSQALRTARTMGMLTVGFTGRDGGRMGELCDYCFTVPSFSIHRIQEAHVLLLHLLWDLVHVAQHQEDVL